MKIGFVLIEEYFPWFEIRSARNVVPFASSCTVVRNRYDVIGQNYSANC